MPRSGAAHRQAAQQADRISHRLAFGQYEGRCVIEAAIGVRSFGEGS